MYKVNVSIFNEVQQIDEDVFVEIEIPFIPQRGDYIHLNDETRIRLAELIKPKLDYYPESLSVHGNKDIAVDDFIYVNAIGYFQRTNSVWIELTDDLAKSY